jgi:isopentenyl-diphosphate delta-isomerase
MTSDLAARKADHLDLCATDQVRFRVKTTLLEQVELVHDALPELSLDGIDTRITLFGKPLEAPIVIAAMTGGTERAAHINRALASIAEARGYGFGLGSQRAMQEDESRGESFKVRDVAPTALVLGNIGAVQARALSTEAALELARRVGADALCVHLNPAMELVQAGGDRDFSGCLEAVARLARELPIPVVAKETGCGLGPRALARLTRAGVRHVDVSGAGGTSWVAVETARAQGSARTLGTALREWGVPTAASVAMARQVRPKLDTIIATGGVASGLDAARALALGAHAVGIARPVLTAFVNGGRPAALELLDQVESELRAVMLLVGAPSVRALRRVDVLLGTELRAWIRLGKAQIRRAR